MSPCSHVEPRVSYGGCPVLDKFLPDPAPKPVKTLKKANWPEVSTCGLWEAPDQQTLLWWRELTLPFHGLEEQANACDGWCGEPAKVPGVPAIHLAGSKFEGG